MNQRQHLLSLSSRIYQLESASGNTLLIDITKPFPADKVRKTILETLLSPEGTTFRFDFTITGKEVTDMYVDVESVGDPDPEGYGRYSDLSNTKERDAGSIYYQVEGTYEDIIKRKEDYLKYSG